MVGEMARSLIAAVVLVVLGAAPAVAGAPTDRLRTFVDRANRIILAPETDGGLDERVSAVRALVTEIFDVEGAAALALGRHWETLPPPARAAFTRLYADVVERAYLAWLGSKARVGEGGVSIRWIDEALEGDAATVSSALRTRAGGELPIEYRMVRRADDWLVRDVVVDGLSLAANYHVQFERVLQMGSYDELVARMHEKAGPVARAEATAATASAVRAMVAAPAPLGPPPIGVAPPAPTSRMAATALAELRDPPAGAIASDATPRAPSVTRSQTTIAGASSAPPADAAARAEVPSAVVAARMIAGPPAPRRQFWVQAGAFRSADAATRLVQRLRRHAVTIAISTDRLAPLARVLVGPFVERSAAVSTVRALEASGIAAFIADTPE
jgi:phospholipid transport system substrate-binding protein